MVPDAPELEAVMRYHERTKHYFNRYARGPGVETGIGCFFDDPVHQVFGLKDLAFQSLYHFTAGGCVDDARLTTLPAYGARVKARQRG